MQVPFLDLVAQGRKLKAEILEMVAAAIDQAAFIGGSNVTGFESEFATYCESRHCVGVASGTDALRFALLAAKVGPGDEVITVANTFIATAEAISQTGAKPIFIDISSDTWNMDPDLIEASLTSRTKAIVPVHLYGRPADMDRILAVATRHNLVVIEDACQAHGAVYKGRKAGSIGHAGCFSFYPGKNLGACGEAGAVTTNDEQFSSFIAKIRDHGQSTKYFHDIEGYNGRLDAIQAGVLRIKLKHLPDWTDARRRHAAYYTELLQEIPDVTLPREKLGIESVFHLFVILADQRENLCQFLQQKGIATGLHYPLPLHLQAAYQGRGYSKGDFPVTESVSQKLISLPIYPELKREQIVYIVQNIKHFLSHPK